MGTIDFSYGYERAASDAAARGFRRFLVHAFRDEQDLSFSSELRVAINQAGWSVVDDAKIVEADFLEALGPPTDSLVLELISQQVPDLTIIVESMAIAEAQEFNLFVIKGGALLSTACVHAKDRADELLVDISEAAAFSLFVEAIKLAHRRVELVPSRP